jgi:hypothetical protein
MDGPPTAALPARAPPAAGTHTRRVARLLMRPASDVALRVRRRDVRAGTRRRVQLASRVGTGAVVAALPGNQMRVSYDRLTVTPPENAESWSTIRLGRVPGGTSKAISTLIWLPGLMSSPSSKSPPLKIPNFASNSRPALLASG